MNRFLTILIILFAALIFFSSCSVSNNPRRKEIKLLQKAVLKDDTSFVYQLPYEINRPHLLVQGYFSRYSHKNRAALDFKMKKGTKICAARKGVVVRLKEDGNKGGWKKEYRPYGNYIVIEHEDSSRAGYWHLKHNGVLVNMGDTVEPGQVIGLSGKTGYALFPHLHFLVWRWNKAGDWRQVATRFQTQKGIIYLRPFRFYRNKKTKD